MSVDAAAVQEELASRIRAGRTPVEAIGEWRWLWQRQVESELLSKQIHAELLRIGDAWLATQLGTSEDELAVPIAAATMYAKFIGERVEISDLTVVPVGKIDAVWREWRTAHGQT